MENRLTYTRYKTDAERAVLAQKRTCNRVLGGGTEDIVDDIRDEAERPRERKKRSKRPANLSRVTSDDVKKTIKETADSGFYLDVPDWIACEPQTYQKIARIAALQMAGIPNKEIAADVGFSNQRLYEILGKYKEEFSHAQKQIIQHAAVQLGVNLFAFRAALLDIMPDCISQLKRLVGSEKVKDTVRLEAIKVVMRASGIHMAQATPLEEQVRKELQIFIREAAEDLGIYNSNVIDVTPGG